MSADRVVWKRVAMATEQLGPRSVYVKHWAVPFAGLMAAADTAFSVPAFVRIAGRRYHGFVTPRDGMAFQQDHDAAWFVLFNREADKLRVEGRL